MIQDSVKPVATTLWLLLLLIGSRESVWADDAKSLFREYSNRIYQIRIIDRSSGKQASIGSGFLITAEGLLITNYHVISDYAHQPERFNVEFVTHDGQQGALSLINIDVVNDLALLKLDVAPGYFIELADSLPAHGESIYSIGNPHDIGWTVIPGTYNGIAAYSFYERIHFSGSVNPGMSGGPLFTGDGNIVGLVTRVVTSTGDGQTVQGVGFALPTDRILAVAERIISAGTDFPRPDFGVVDERTLSDFVAGQIGVDRTEGTFLVEISRVGGLAQAGLRPGDIILSLNGFPLTSDSPYLNVLQELEPGQPVDVVYVDQEGDEHSVEVIPVLRTR